MKAIVLPAANSLPYPTDMLRVFAYWIAVGLLASIASDLLAAEPAKIDFDRQIRPILSNHCYRCHGPDAGERQAGFRLDVRDSALSQAESGAKPIVPGDPKQSELIARIHTTDADTVMPPASLNKPLTAEQKALLERWIAEGANYRQHWAFVPPQRAALPEVQAKTWPRNAIDYFVLQRLEAAGLRPSPEAERYELIRRVTFDLTGLPPTPQEVADFVNDNDPQAYEKVVDRLLDSPHYGERLAVDWLDAARFADTNGFHLDNGRDMTRWREWVINAFNRNQPFDQFTIEQLAGDLLPQATLEQKIASGFNRNHMINFEGGAVAQEYHNAYIVDRVSTTSTVWLGLTVACAQCHDHKYDPISQKEFYQLYAFFYNVPENGLDGNQGNAAPLLKTPTAAQQQELTKLEQQVAALKQDLQTFHEQDRAAQQAWEAGLPRSSPVWTVLEPTEMRTQSGAVITAKEQQPWIVSGKNAATDRYIIPAKVDLRSITAVRIETGVDDVLAARGPGRSANGNVVLTNVSLTIAGNPQTFSQATADYSQANFDVAKAIDDDANSGWALDGGQGKPHFAVFSLAKPVESEQPQELTLELAFESVFGQHQLGTFRVLVTDAKDPHHSAALPEAVSQALSVSPEERSQTQQDLLQTHFRERVSQRHATLRQTLADTQKKLAEVDRAAPSTMIMQEMGKPRATRILTRGQYDQPGEQVNANVPAVLPPLPADGPRNRLALAHWLVDPQHPLTSRVIVNRYWQLIFGTGLVKTVEDLGSQGEAPSHPELLDYLAVEFIAPQNTNQSTPWDVKALLRMFVTSSTYRQSARTTPASVTKDSENRLLARGPRQRLQAEFIRDQALAISGLMNKEIGGKSVSPYQPPGLWGELSSRGDSNKWTAQFFEQSHGEDLYRRTMYTFWKRTSPPPQLATFDAPDRETCTVRRLRTNTPLQALILLNDPTYVEASRKLAERMMKEGGASVDERIAFAFRLATARLPSDREATILRNVFESQRRKMQAEPNLAAELLAVGEALADKQFDPQELASYALVASVILNLDETVTK